ncbi:MAG: hydroxymethylglutaryl-CoA lyase [Desulfobacteraceae bacterium]|nr:hydroxymethylglutaryl-CoA lyase [Desulfobacteraceae bacterium]
MPYPESVTLIEVGPRDGFQFEKQNIPTSMKIDIINRLIRAGLTQIQVTSFVHPDRVPQMADAELIIAGLDVPSGVSIDALVLNMKGVERACKTGLKRVEVSLSASDTHSRKNTGMTFDDAFAHGVEMIAHAKKIGLAVRAGVQCAFGCAYEGKVGMDRVRRMVETYLTAGADEISLADTTGMAVPMDMQRIPPQVLSITGKTPFTLHLHNTRGLGLVNTMAALDTGVSRFDTAMGGMGGCPFVPNAAGNISTEDTAYLMQTMGIQTGININAVAGCSRMLESFLGKHFDGKLHRLI